MGEVQSRNTSFLFESGFCTAMVTLIEKRHAAYVLFTRNILLGTAYCLEWSLKFILYLALHLVDVLEALTSVLLQVFRIVRLTIKVFFTFGVLMQFVGRSFGVAGSFLFVLSLLTYFCFWCADSSYVSAVSDVLHINVCIVSLCVWVITIPIGGFLVFVRLRSKINQQIELLVNYNELYKDSEYVDKSTETLLQQRIEVPGAGARGITSKELLVDESTETETEAVESPDADVNDEVISSKDPFPSTSLSQRKDSSSSEGTENVEEEKEKERKSVPKGTPRRRRKDESQAKAARRRQKR